MIYAILVNYNGAADTIECLETLLRSEGVTFRVVVCDNGSTDHSLERICRWGDGETVPDLFSRGSHALLARAPLSRPIPYVRLARDEAEQGIDDAGRPPLVLIDCGANLGFAGGNNVGLRWALAQGDLEYAWLLNNDTVVEPGAMLRMVRRLKESDGGGVCCSTLLHYGKPERVQALGGGWYCKWIGLAWHIGRLSRWSGTPDVSRAERLMNYPVGASVMVTARFLAEVGLMCEDYFLYFEELDWMLRAGGRFRLVYAADSVVYHKVGASVGTSSNPARKSAACDYWNVRNRIFFTRRHFPEALPTVYLALFATLAARVLLGRWDRAAMVLRLLAGKEIRH